ncbi:MAG: hypothetical protein IT487_19230 [Chromatiaceae bacterium]|nr:hypothetical protein [Chromatiaceae bacterium]
MPHHPLQTDADHRIQPQIGQAIALGFVPVPPAAALQGLLARQALADRTSRWVRLYRQSPRESRHPPTPPSCFSLILVNPRHRLYVEP